MAPLVVLALIILLTFIIIIVAYHWAQTRRRVALVSTSSYGMYTPLEAAKGAAPDPMPADIKIGLDAVISGLVPLKPCEQIVFAVKRPNETLPQCFENLYEMGVRIFVGAFSTDELKSLSGFNAAHKNLAIISTASTGRGLELDDNIYRFATTDSKAAPLFASIMLNDAKAAGAVPPPKFIMIYEKSSAYAVPIADSFAAAMNITQTYDSNVATEVAAAFAALRQDKSTSLVFIVANGGAEHWIDAIPGDLENKIYLSDLFAFFPFDEARMTKIRQMGMKSFVCWPMHETAYAFGTAVIGRPCSPFLYNILMALWYASDMFHAGVSRMSGPHVTVQHLIDAHGDLEIVNTALVGVNATTNDWDVLSGEMHNPFLQRFDYFPHVGAA